MQFKSIVAFASLASMVAALPAEIEKRTTGQDVQNQCSQEQTAKCCKKLKSVPILNLLNLGLLSGINCLNLDLIAVIGGGQCGQRQSLACCSSGDQYGLVNIGNVCVPVSL